MPFGAMCVAIDARGDAAARLAQRVAVDDEVDRAAHVHVVERRLVRFIVR